MEISQNNLEALIQDFAKELHCNTTMVIGGAACAMHHCKSFRSTDDVDVRLISFSSDDVERSAGKVGKQHSLTRWLDNDWHHKYEPPTHSTQFVGKTHHKGKLTYYWYSPACLVCFYIHSVLERPRWAAMRNATQIMLERELTINDVKALYRLLYGDTDFSPAECVFDMVAIFRNQVRLSGFELASAYSLAVTKLKPKEWQKRVRDILKFTADDDFYNEVKELCRRYENETSNAKAG